MLLFFLMCHYLLLFVIFCYYMLLFVIICYYLLIFVFLLFLFVFFRYYLLSFVFYLLLCGIIPARSAGFYNCTCKKKSFGSIGTPSGKTLITMEFCVTRPDPATREHAQYGIDFAAFFGAFSRKFEGFDHPYSFNFMGRISVARVFSVCFLSTACFPVGAHRVTCKRTHSSLTT